MLNLIHVFDAVAGNANVTAAATEAAEQTNKTASWIPTLIMILAMVGIFYFMIIRPQKKRDNQAKEMRNSIKVGDEIVTIGGICGKVTNVKDDTGTILSSVKQDDVPENRHCFRRFQRRRINNHLLPA